MEKKTARGSKVTAKVLESPRTPKIRKRSAPLSKKRRVGDSPITQIGTSVEVDPIPDPPMPIEFKTKPGKVCFVILINWSSW